MDMKKMVAALVLLASGFASLHAQEARYAVVDFSVSYLRAQPDYESPLETQELMGTVVEILDTDRYWVQVKSPQPYVAWCTDKGLAPMTADQLKEYEAAPKYMCMAPFSRIYASPSKEGMVSDLVMGDVLVKAVNPKGKAVRSGKMVMVSTPSGREGWVEAKDLMDYAKWKESCDGSAASIVALAKTFAGVPYLWGGMSPKGFDCSGLVRHCHMMNGVLLPRNASQQIRLGAEAPLDSLVPGDLLFFGSVDEGGKEHVTHVGMYIGGGRFIHSSHLVRINSMDPGDEDAYENIHKLLRARRILK